MALSGVQSQLLTMFSKHCEHVYGKACNRTFRNGGGAHRPHTPTCQANHVPFYPCILQCAQLDCVQLYAASAPNSISKD